MGCFKSQSSRSGGRSRDKRQYPEGYRLLMDYGFGLTFLNIVFGLLPLTIRGYKVSYYRLSIVKLYGVVLILTLLYASVLFVIQNNVLKLLDNHLIMTFAYVPTTYIVALTLNVFSQVIGFLCLLIQGQNIGRQAPEVWRLISKAMETCIIQLNGRDFVGLKSLRKYSRKILTFYVLTIALNESSVQGAAGDDPQFEDSLHALFYKLAYVFWDFALFSHVLICILLGFFMKSLEICLRSVNETLEELVDDIEFSTTVPPTLEEVQRLVAENHGVETIATRLGFVKNSSGLNVPRTSRSPAEEEHFIQKLNTIKNCYKAVEDAVGQASSVFGLSLFIEVLIIFGNSLTNAFFIFEQYFFKINQGVTDAGHENWSRFGNETWGPLMDLCIQFFFFIVLATASSNMSNEAKKSIGIVKKLDYTKYPERLQPKLLLLRSDLDPSKVRLTAADFFDINKNLIITTATTIISFLVVLIQFNSTDKASIPENSDFGSSYVPPAC